MPPAIKVALQEDYGKPRPALVIQSDLFDQHPSVTVLPVTGELQDAPLFRFRVEPDAFNGLQKTSDILVDKAQAIPRARAGEVFGQLSEEQFVGSASRAGCISGNHLIFSSHCCWYTSSPCKCTAPASVSVELPDAKPQRANIHAPRAVPSTSSLLA